MVTSPHVLASQAGLEILRSSGNAIEAALTIASCLAVTYPHFSGFGGDSFLIVSDAKGKMQTISGNGQAAQNPGDTLNPGMYFKGGKLNILYGTQGADGQPQTLATILTRLIDCKMDPLTALTKPRFLLGKTFSNSDDSLKLEADVGESVMAELAGRGHQIATFPAQSPLVGHPGAIVIDPATGLMTGAHDPRSDGRAIGL